MFDIELDSPILSSYSYLAEEEDSFLVSLGFHSLIRLISSNYSLSCYSNKSLIFSFSFLPSLKSLTSITFLSGLGEPRPPSPTFCLLNSPDSSSPSNSYLVAPPKVTLLFLEFCFFVSSSFTSNSFFKLLLVAAF